MESLTFNKICHYCNKEFAAHKRTTKYCCHKCNQRAYKQAKKEEKNNKFEDNEILKQTAIRSNILLEEILKEIKNTNSKMFLTTKPYLLPSEVCQLLNIGRATYNRFVSDKTFKIYKIGKRKTYIKRSDIDKLFNSNV